MRDYQIIDEPKPGAQQGFVLDPLVILFASLIIPIFIDIPVYGKYWLPFIWILFNGYCLGSPTLKKEIYIGVIALVSLAASFLPFIIYAAQESNLEAAKNFAPYFRILINAIKFFFLYLIVFYQQHAYALFEYLYKEDH